MAYEGNFHLNALPGLAPNHAAAITFFDKVQRDPRAQAITAANLDAFAAAGGSVNVFFNLGTPASGGGVFGIVGTPAMTEAKRRMGLP
jgi:hypothetical protein